MFGSHAAVTCVAQNTPYFCGRGLACETTAVHYYVLHSQLFGVFQCVIVHFLKADLIQLMELMGFGG